jgi:hypothetical protein
MKIMGKAFRGHIVIKGFDGDSLINRSKQQRNFLKLDINYATPQLNSINVYQFSVHFVT